MKNLLGQLKALSDETRLRIINLLYEKELCVCDIMEALKITQTKASRHLTYLRSSGLVSDRKHAQWVYYSVIRSEDTKYMDSLVYDNLRRIEVFLNDLGSMAKWLKEKNIDCD